MTSRSNSGSYYSSSYNDYNPWSVKVLLSLSNYLDGYKPLFITRFTFDLLSLLAFGAFLRWACQIRNRSLPLKGLICVLVFFILSQMNIAIWGALYISDAVVMRYYIITLMIWNFFRVVAICLTFYVFWSLIHRFLGLLSVSGRPHTAVTTIHYTLLALTFLASLAEWALYVASYVGRVTSSYDDTAQLIWVPLNNAIHIVYWALSFEVFVWMIFVVIKAGRHLLSKAPAVALLTAAMSWFGVCSAFAISYIRYSLVYPHNSPPIYLDTAKAIMQFVFWLGTYAGILLCCSRWHMLGDGSDKDPAPQYTAQHPLDEFPPNYYARSPDEQCPPVQHPYGVAPYQDHSSQPQDYPHRFSSQ
ncbi:unnamed protein product [Penicillium glandicola]